MSHSLQKIHFRKSGLETTIRPQGGKENLRRKMVHVREQQTRQLGKEGLR